MLRLHTNKKRILPTLIGIMVFLPAIPVIVRNLSSNDTSAIDLPEGFTDPNFYNCVVNTIGAEYVNAETGPTTAQLESITALTCSGRQKPEEEKIKNTNGLEKMTALTYLNVQDNQLTSIGLSKNTALTYINLGWNQLTSIDLSKNTALTTLNLRNNQLTSIIGLSNNKNLKELRLDSNQLTNIDLTDNTNLADLRINSNKLSSVTLPHSKALT